jgi:hypothetical protein
VTIGFSDRAVADIEAFLQRVGPQESVRHDCIEEIIEPEMTRAYYVQVADDDLTDGPPAA